VRRLFAVLLWMAAAREAQGHSFEPALLDLRERDPGVFDVVWRPPGRESGAVLPGDPALEPVLPARCRRLVDLGASGEGSEEWIAFRVDCGATRLRGETIAVPGIAGSRVDAIVRLTWSDGDVLSGVLRSDSEELVVPAAPSGGMLRLGAPARTVAWRYLALGVEHILHGYDHVLFVVGLFLLVGATRALVTTISAFTLAHSLTLAAAVLGLVHVPSAPVEATIALSIVLLARELVRTPDEPPTLTRRYPWAVAFAFGLLHGLGFAGALAETGVPADQIPLALVAFNLGVEAGQLLIVGALVGLAVAFRRRLPEWPWLRRLPAYAMGTVAVAWTIERVLRYWPGLA
jgi:hydrogenase/urease accessory protein HupE